MKTELKFEITHRDEETVIGSADLTHESWKEIGYGRAPDAIRIDENGHESWYYVTLVAGMDDDGPYEYVTDGPASGEKVYARW